MFIGIVIGGLLGIKVASGRSSEAGLGFGLMIGAAGGAIIGALIPLI